MYYWTFFGSALLWDTVQTEAAHRPLVKDIYRKSGKVRLGLLNDLFIRLHRARLFSNTKRDYEIHFGLEGVTQV